MDHECISQTQVWFRQSRSFTNTHSLVCIYEGPLTHTHTYHIHFIKRKFSVLDLHLPTHNISLSECKHKLLHSHTLTHPLCLTALTLCLTSFRICRNRNVCFTIGVSGSTWFSLVPLEGTRSGECLPPAVVCSVALFQSTQWIYPSAIHPQLTLNHRGFSRQVSWAETMFFVVVKSREEMLVMSYFGGWGCWQVVWVSAPLQKCEKCAGDGDNLWLSAVYTPLLGPMFPYYVNLIVRIYSCAQI